jgi:hypothetical protein
MKMKRAREEVPTRKTTRPFLAMDDAVRVAVSFRGAAHEVATSRGATLRSLGEALAQATGASVATLRVLHAGRALPLGDDAARTRTLADAGLPPASGRLLLLGASAAEVDAMHAAPLAAAAHAAHAREAPQEHAATVAARRRGRGAAAQPIRLPPGPHTFVAFRALPAPQGLTLTPSPAAALRLLHRLAADAGIAAVMAARRWRVGLLSEMPPEGKVGISESCVLGYNVNAGQEIALRLRTDDWRGFRRYERIRETLIHELAHMVHGPHDLRFKALNSELTVQAAVADWTRREGRTLAGGAADAWEAASWAEEEEEEDTSVMGQTARDSGKALGGHAPAASAHDAASAAAQRRAAAAEAARAEAAMAAEAARALAPADTQAPAMEHDATHADAPAAPPPLPAAPLLPPPVDDDAAVPMTTTTAAAADAAEADAEAVAAWSLADDADPELSRLAAAAEAARQRATSAAAALASGGADAADADTALHTVASVLRNVLEHPGAAQYRVLRRGNPAFEARAGRFPAAIELLRAAGFVEEAEPAASNDARRLRLARDDPGLLWLALSAVNDALEARRAVRAQ